MKFGKWSGLGNDFIFPEPGERVSPAAVPRLCDRRNGIGGDGVILISPLGGNDFEMKIFNADGSEAAMCGNATRCAAKYILSRNLGKGTVFHLHTLSGIVSPELLADGRVRVDMGAPREFLGDIVLAAAGRRFEAVTVSMGNPHAVIFTGNVSAVPLETWGPILEHDPQFPDRCNIEFSQILDAGRIRMRVWERGCGITSACGTGSCATLAAAQKKNLCGDEADIILDGGVLHIEHKAGQSVFMTGPALEIFTGEIENEQ